MKKVLLLAVALVFGFITFAQVKPAKVSIQYQNLKATRIMGAVHETMNFSTQSNPSVAPQSSKSVNEVIIGNTRYDLQSNQSVQNRIYLHTDGSIGATYTFGMTETAFSDRGTGYNYNTGSAWGANPTARIEPTRNGWPSYAPLGAGEIVVSHNGTNGLLISKRAVKGTGNWTTTTLVGPTTTGNTTALLWPRMITSGNTVHIIACTDQAESPTIWYYKGLALALVYIRSTDGGSTWDAPRILPGMDSASIVSNVRRGFSGDAYSWAKAKGDTVAFAVGESWQDLFIMKSYDGGTNWMKIPVFNFPQIFTFPTPRMYSNDGSMAVCLDNTGKAHVVFGRTAVSKSSGSPDSIGYSSYYPYTDGLVYWNEDMAVLDTTQLASSSGLNANGQWVGAMLDYSGNDSIDFPVVPAGTWPFGTYYGSLSSFPQITMDNSDIFISYSSCREDKIDATGTKLYRHLYITKKPISSGTWTDPGDVTGSVIHDYDECVFGSMSYTSDANIHMIFQADDTPGLAVRGDETPYGDNIIYYVRIPKDEIGPAIGIKENTKTFNMNIYPNPSRDYTHIDLNLAKTSDVIVTVTNLVGQKVISKSFGKFISGNHKLAIEVDQLNSGIYFFTVQAGNERITKKIVVN